MVNLKRLAHKGLWCLLLAAAAGIVWHGLALYRADQQNRQIRQLLAGRDITLDKVVRSEPQVRLARAIYLAEKHRYDEALATLNQILNNGDTALQAKIRYNLGNVYLIQAIEAVDAMRIDDAVPLTGLAKQAYRQALTLNSQFWDAKYNLEVALRLLPEMERISRTDEEPEAERSELWTTVPGFPRGLP